MKLIYLELINYKGYTGRLSFSSKYVYYYKEDTLYIDNMKDDEYIDNFFDINSNIDFCAIIGKNGSGKSRILEAIENIFNNSMNEESKYNICFNLGKNIYYNSNFKINIKSESDLNIKKLSKMETISFMSYFAEMPYQFASRAQKHKIGNTVSLSTKNIMKLLQKNNSLEKKFQTNLFMFKANYLYFEYQFNYKFIYQYLNNLEPEEFSSNDNFQHHRKELIYHLTKKFYGLSYDANNTNIKYNKEFEYPILKILYFTAIIINKIHDELFNDDINNSVILDSIREIYNNIDTSNNLDFKKEILALEDLFKKENIYEKFNIRVTLDIFIDFILNKKHLELSSEYFDEFMLFESFLKMQFLMKVNNNDILFDYLSHGQKTTFGLLLNLFINVSFSKNDHFLFILDEPELSLHPEWQRLYINELVEVFSNFNKNIQFILTSHSPFIVSDLPRNRIIFLDDNIKKEKTFASNIHTLLAENFIDENLPLGEFANNKIKRIISTYKEIKEKKIINLNIRENIKEFKLIKSCISDEYLANIINNHIEEIEDIVYGNDKKEELEIKRYIELIGEDKIKKYMTKL